MSSFHRLVYGFDDENNADVDIYGPCRKAILTFLMIRSLRSSCMNLINKQIILIIAKIIWSDRSTFLDLKQFYIPMYGTNDSNKVYGFEFGRINELFDNPSFVYNGELRLNTALPPVEIIDMYTKHFPKVKMHSHAMIQNVYTSHYACGSIMYGYWFEIEDKDDDGYQYEIEITTDITLDDNKIEFVNVSHTCMVGNTNRFCGIELCYIGGVECSDDMIEWHNMFSRTYKPVKILTPEEIEKRCDAIIKITLKYPILTFIPTMCYCCT